MPTSHSHACNCETFLPMQLFMQITLQGTTIVKLCVKVLATSLLNASNSLRKCKPNKHTMDNIIYESAQAAKTACEEYIKAVYDMQDKFGLREENEDYCTSTYLYAKYLDCRGNVVEYCHN